MSKAKSKLDRTALTNMPILSATKATMTIIDAIQDLKPHEQLAGIAATFLLLADYLEIEPQDAFVIVKNIMNGAEGKRTEFKAVEAYLEGEFVK